MEKKMAKIKKEKIEEVVSEEANQEEQVSQEEIKANPCYFEELEEYKHSFDLDFVIDVLKSLYCKKQGGCITRESGATLMKNTFRPVLSLAEGIGGIRREVVFSFKGSYFKVSAICKPEDDQRFVDWDNPKLLGESTQVMAQKVDMTKVWETAFVPSAS
jgi:hypothetical protein